MDKKRRLRVVLDIDYENEKYLILRGGYQDACITVKLMTDSDAEIVVESDISHPNVMRRLFGVDADNDKDSYAISDCVDCNLDELKNRLTVPVSSHVDLIAPLTVDVLTQIIFGVDSMRYKGKAHGNLNMQNVGILMFPHCHSCTVDESLYSTKYNHQTINAGPKLIVKLKGSKSLVGNEKNYVEDLISFGSNLLAPILKELGTAENCLEVADLIARINGHEDRGSRQHLFSDEVRAALSLRLRNDFVEKATLIVEHPTFVDTDKTESFFCTLGEYLDEVYHDKACHRVSFAPLEPPVAKFVADLKRLDLRGWKWKMEQCVLDNSCHSTNFHNADDEDSILGVIKAIRHTVSHWERFKTYERESMGVEGNCYPYFKRKFPQLFLHAYTCLQLNYKDLERINDDSFNQMFMPYVSSGSRGIYLESNGV